LGSVCLVGASVLLLLAAVGLRVFFHTRPVQVSYTLSAQQQRLEELRRERKRLELELASLKRYADAEAAARARGFIPPGREQTISVGAPRTTESER
jgi:hypothetical protein